MELKDLILSTLNELDEQNIEPLSAIEPSKQNEEVYVDEPIVYQDNKNESLFISGETKMLEGIRERLLVLFEGFQAPNNKELEAKVDLTLNFLEYLLVTIENRLDKIKEN